jgi:hypothetical protein
MDIVEKFLSHAGECRQMARSTHDLQSKAVWNRMADRWLALAINEKARIRQRVEPGARRVRMMQPRAA